MKRKEKHTFYNFQFKHTAVTITNHPNIQSMKNWGQATKNWGQATVSWAYPY